ncbi:hypothetical protein TNCV_3489291 [Trichonephila clavipes]|nr:hypothetical protein TNCV_3489291 [Trichonephila clavipes]
MGYGMPQAHILRRATLFSPVDNHRLRMWRRLVDKSNPITPAKGSPRDQVVSWSGAPSLTMISQLFFEFRTLK